MAGPEVRELRPANPWLPWTYPDGPLGWLRDGAAFRLVMVIPGWRGGLWDRTQLALLPYAGAWAYAAEALQHTENNSPGDGGGA